MISQLILRNLAKKSSHWETGNEESHLKEEQDNNTPADNDLGASQSNEMLTLVTTKF